MEVAVEAVRLNTLSKLTFKDSVLFDKIVEDVFVGVKFIGSDFDEITAALKSSYEDLGLQYNEIQVFNINLRYMETKTSADSLMLPDKEMHRTL